MKILFLWLMPILLIIGSTNEANARSKKKKGKAKTEQQTDSVQKKKKSVYDKLFKDKKKHTVNKGTITVHQYEDKIYLELPIELMGRDFLVNSAITTASDISLAGTKAAQSRYLIIDTMFASTNRTIIKKRLLHYLVVMLFTKHFQLKDTPAIQRLLYLMPLPISLVPIKMYSILADAVMEVCSQLQALPLKVKHLLWTLQMHSTIVSVSLKTVLQS